jgi:hypothetical protein
MPESHPVRPYYGSMNRDRHEPGVCPNCGGRAAMTFTTSISVGEGADLEKPSNVTCSNPNCGEEGSPGLRGHYVSSERITNERVKRILGY